MWQLCHGGGVCSSNLPIRGCICCLCGLCCSHHLVGTTCQFRPSADLCICASARNWGRCISCLCPADGSVWLLTDSISGCCSISCLCPADGSVCLLTDSICGCRICLSIDKFYFGSASSIGKSSTCRDSQSSPVVSMSPTIEWSSSGDFEVGLLWLTVAMLSDLLPVCQCPGLDCL